VASERNYQSKKLAVVLEDFKLYQRKKGLDHLGAGDWKLVVKVKNSPLVSFLISAYNEEQYIQSCIESCLNQTYQYIEIILVNDGSNDLTSQIINQNYRNNTKIKIIDLTKNLGKVNGFNLAFEAATGAYIALMGADDICYPQRIEKSLEHLNENQGMVCSDLDKINSKGQIIENRIINTRYGALKREDFSTKKLIETPKVFGGTIFLARTTAEKIFPLDINLSHEDWYIPLKASLHCKIAYVDEPLIAYRIHAKNSSSSTEKRIFNYSKWFYLNTRDTAYYCDLIQLVDEFSIDTDVSKIKFYFAKSLLLKEDEKFKVFFKYLPQIKGKKRKLLFSLHLFPYLLYVLAMLARLKRSFL
jgi:glycosyltransferase involved in cell wall biosynthesis